MNERTSTTIVVQGRCLNQNFKRVKSRERGSATMEYVIVSTFAALLSIAAITFVGRMVKTKVNSMAEKLNMDATEFDFDLGFNQ